MSNMNHQEMELHIESHFAGSPKEAAIAVSTKTELDVEKQAQKIREQREFEMLRAQYGMDNQGNFREQSAAGMVFSFLYRSFSFNKLIFFVLRIYIKLLNMFTGMQRAVYSGKGHFFRQPW